MKTTNKKVNAEVSKGFQPLDRAELILGAFLENGHMSNGYLAMGSNGFYYAGDNKFISYRKIRHDDDKRALIKDYSEDLLEWNLHEDKHYVIFSFMHVRKSYEHKITQALTAIPEHLPYYWDRWCLFDDGTILEPKLTEKFIKKIELKENQLLQDEDNYLESLVLSSGPSSRDVISLEWL